VEARVSQAFDQDEISKLILDAITKRVGGAVPAQPVLGTHAPVILDGLVGATVAVIAGAVPSEHWRLVAAEFSGRLAVAIESRLKAEQDSRQSH
jgi:hypothetical protein